MKAPQSKCLAVAVMSLLGVLGPAWARAADKSTDVSRPQWVALFSGEDLQGWIPKINHHPLGENYLDTFSVTAHQGGSPG